MPPLIREENKLKCPASETAHPVLSLNSLDILCQIEGGLRPEKGSPCTDSCYFQRCPIWRTTKDLERMGRGNSPDLRQRRPHVLTGDLKRDTLRV